ncbi:FtsK/SpoIIIE domain-containing protein [Amycolatopsis sp. NPDC001319]|uniref:FtsK/SpoIIIE domain-containing protein n=1 Tax=unclassified Amycolatopsis TaxID=2618356 RepID=UPI0036785FE9
MSTTADHAPDAVNATNPEGLPSVNTTPNPSTNTTTDQAVNTDPATAVNAHDTAATDTAVTRSGAVVPVRPDTARTTDQIPAQDRTDTAPDVVDGMVVEGVIVDDEDPAARVNPLLVDQPDPKAAPSWWAGAREAKTREVIPGWARSRNELLSRAKWLAGYAGHTCAYHAVRTPRYVGVLVLHSPRGLARIVVNTHRWVFDAEAKPLRTNAVAAGNTEEYRKLAELRTERVRKRSTAVFLAFLVLVAGLYLFVGAVTGWGWYLAAGTATAALLGTAGGRADKPIVSRAVIAARVPKLTSDVVLNALGSLGIAKIDQTIAGKGEKIHFPAPIVRDGDGWRAEVELPYGVTVDMVMERRDKLASGLRRPLGCVWPEPVSDEHPGRLVIWVGDKPLNKQKAPTWPLAKRGRVNLFEPIPFGTDQRGRPVVLTMMFVAMLIGAMPRMGKTFALRILVLAAALDPMAELLLFELKGTGDLGMCKPVAHRYASGADNATLEEVMDGLRYLVKEMDRRAKVLSRIAESDPKLCPENKVTPHLSSTRDLGLHPIFAVIDECQELFSHEEFKEEANKLAEAITKRGPAMGLMLVLATQRPDASSLPKGISANAGLRFCLRVMAQPENDMILGTGAYKRGINAALFSFNDKGIGYLAGESDDPKITRTYLIDGPAAEGIVERARVAREAAGTITGYAAGQVDQAGEDTKAGHVLILDVAAVLKPGEKKVWSESIVDRLAALRPEVYGAWGTLDGRGKANQLATSLAPWGVETIQVYGKDETGKAANRRGVNRVDVFAAVDKHNQN